MGIDAYIETNDRIKRILSKLEEVRKKNLSCFGSEKHGFRMNPKLTESEITDFEKKHGVRLPEDYRQFLLKVGNGGAGPYYGIQPLEEWNHVATWINDIDDEENPGDYLSRPSPFHPGMSREEKTWKEELKKEDPGFAWESIYQGAIALAHQGCTYYSMLIVSGSAKGRVFYVELQGSGPPFFVVNTDFISWYERWLDKLLAGHKIGWFGYDMPSSG